MATLSICMIVKNEEENLRKTLPAMAASADELIIVDTGSTDGTVELARSFGAKVYSFPWINDFSAARNESLKYATQEWILWLDADEYMKEDDLKTLKHELDGRSEWLCYLPVCECLYGTTDEKSRYFRDKIFRNHLGIHFERPINEQVVFPAGHTGKTAQLPSFPIYHWGRDLSEEKMARKNTERAVLFEKVLEVEGGDPHYHYLLGCRYLDLHNQERALKELDEAIRTAVNDSDRYLKEGAHLRRGWIFFEKNDFVNALAEGLAARDLNPSNAESYCLAGGSCLALGRMEEAVQIMEKSAELIYREHPVLGTQIRYWNFLRYSFMANAYIATQQYAKAMAPLAQALQAEPQNETLTRLFGMLNQMVNRTETVRA